MQINIFIRKHLLVKNTYLGWTELSPLRDMLDGRSPLFNASTDNFRRLPRQPMLDNEALDNVRFPIPLTSSTLLDQEDCDDVESTRFLGASRSRVRLSKATLLVYLNHSCCSSQCYALKQLEVQKLPVNVTQYDERLTRN